MANVVRNKGETGLHGKYYERGIALWIALRCLSEKDIEDFWILCNPAGIDKFDDIVLNIQYKNRKNKLFFLQIKHKKESGKELKTCMLESSKKYNLKIYEGEFSKIVESKKNNFLKFNNIGEDVEMFFCIYTNLRKATDEQNSNIRLKQTLCDSSGVVDSSDQNNCKNIYNVEDEKNSYSNPFIKRLFIYLNQIDEDDIEERICNHYKFNLDMVKSLRYDFVRRFEPPNQDEKFFKSHLKKDMLNRFFGKYRPPEQCFNDRTISTNLLPVITTFKITIIKKNYSEVRIWCDILNEIEEIHQGLRMENWDDSVREKYIDLVFQDKIPFFLTTDSSEFESFERFFLDTVCDSVIVYKNKNHVSFENCNGPVLEFVDDLTDDVLRTISVKSRISFQGKLSVDGMGYLQKLKSDTEKHDFDLLIKYFDRKIKITGPEKIPSYYINRKIKVPTIHLRKKRSKSNNDIYSKNCIRVFFKCSKKLAKVLRLSSFVDYLFFKYSEEDILGYYFEHAFEIHYLKFISENRINSKQHVHIFEIMESGKLCLPICQIGYGKCTAVTVTSITKEDKELMNFCKSSKVNIICNNAGEGKSMLLKFLSRNFPEDCWVISINLSMSHMLSGVMDFTNLYEELYEIEKKNTNQVFHDILWTIYQSCFLMQKFVWLIDDYEEIETPQLLRILKEAWEAGIKILITSRPSKRNKLERHFGTKAMTLTLANEKEQVRFFEKYFSEMDSNVNVETILDNIHTLRRKMNETFIGVFQQMVMLAEIVNCRPELLITDLEIVDIYKIFVDLQVLSYPPLHRDMVRIIMRKLAIVHLFPKAVWEFCFDLNELLSQMDFFRHYPKGCMVTTTDKKNKPIFCHRTYAEFLAADWLVEKVQTKQGCGENTINKFIEKLYSKELSTVRYFFDSILTKDCPILLAAVNGNYELIDKLYSNEPNIIGTKDILGRTFLHFLIGNELLYDVSNDTLRRDSENASFVDYSVDGCTYVNIPKPTDSPPMEQVLYQWFERIQVNFDDDHQNIYNNFLGRNLIDYILMVGSLSILNHLISTRQVMLPRLDKEQTYLALTYSIINNFHSIMGKIQYADLGITTVRVLNYSGMSLLHLSLHYKNTPAFGDLLNRETNLEEWGYDSDGNSVLHLACELNDRSGVMSLLGKGEYSPDFLNKKNVNGHTCFHILCYRGYDELILKLNDIPEVDVNSVCNDGNTPFLEAVISRNLSRARLLKRKKTNVDHRNKKGNAALHYASMKNDKVCAKQLIKWKADINSKNEYGLTPLSFAIMYNNQNVFGLLLQNEAEVNCLDRNNFTPLHHAIKRNRVKYLEPLLQKGIKVAIRSKRGDTALMMACRLNNKEAVKCLLNYETKKKLREAQTFAQRTGRQAIAQIIETHISLFYSHQTC